MGNYSIKLRSIKRIMVPQSFMIAMRINILLYI